MVCQRYKQFACRVNQPASSWVALSAKRMLIFSLLDSVEIRDCIPLYANSFDLNARHLQVLFTGIRCRSQVCATIYLAPYSFYRTPVSESCRTPVPVCLRLPFVHLWTPVCAFVERPYPYPCVWALGGNFIMTRTVQLFPVDSQIASGLTQCHKLLEAPLFLRPSKQVRRLLLFLPFTLGHTDFHSSRDLLGQNLLVPNLF